MGTAGRQRGFAFAARQLLAAILFAALLAIAIRQPAETYTWWHLENELLMMVSLPWIAVVALLMRRDRRGRLQKMVLAGRPEEIAPREDTTAICIGMKGTR